MVEFCHYILQEFYDFVANSRFPPLVGIHVITELETQYARVDTAYKLPAILRNNEKHFQD